MGVEGKQDPGQARRWGRWQDQSAQPQQGAPLPPTGGEQTCPGWPWERGGAGLHLAQSSSTGFSGSAFALTVFSQHRAGALRRVCRGQDGAKEQRAELAREQRKPNELRRLLPPSASHTSPCLRALSLVVSDSATPWTVAHQASLCPWGFSRPEYWSGLPCPPPGDLPHPGTEPRSPTWLVDSFRRSHQGSPSASRPYLLRRGSPRHCAGLHVIIFLV